MTLPILISIPHGGLVMPAEVEGRAVLSAADVFSDGDACTLEIYDVGDAVATLIKSMTARAIVDLNRAPDDLPPGNPDGVVKSLTADRRPVYLNGDPPDAALAEMLIERYWRPYHAQLRAAAEMPGLQLGLDCHSMADRAPAIASQPGTQRPLFCLSNDEGRTAPASMMAALAAALADAFDVSIAAIGLNDPFTGGYITRHHGHHPLPWVQVEMNRALYLAPPWFDAERRTVDAPRVADLRTRFTHALEQLDLT